MSPGASRGGCFPAKAREAEVDGRGRIPKGAKTARCR